MGKFDGKVIIVTGSSAGIGRVTAILFAEQGATLTITGRNATKLEETKNLLLKAGSKEEKILSVIADVTKEEDTKKLIAETVNKFGKLDVLGYAKNRNKESYLNIDGQDYWLNKELMPYLKVNNAGGIDGGACDVFKPLNIFDDVINQNLRSVLSLCQEAIPHLRKTKGNIVNVSSISAFRAFPDQAYYGIAKAGLDHMNRILAIQLAADGIRVNTINPGATRTDALSPEVWDATEETWMKPCTPLARLGQPKEMAHIISFLANNEESSYITGENIVADGGLSIKTAPPTFDLGKK